MATSCFKFFIFFFCVFKNIHGIDRAFYLNGGTFPAKGEDLITHGYQEKEIGEVIGRLKKKWYASFGTLTKEDLLTF